MVVGELRCGAHPPTIPEPHDRSHARRRSLRGYYGSVNHDVKAIYQPYIGFFDGNPANPHPHPPVEAARRYVEYMGGAPQILTSC
jgi:alkyl sulfatase BDS1-like metallo-beta-lactamase superfamily hydrolase